MFLIEEAQTCRRLAVFFEGRRERSFLLNVALAFEDLAADGFASKAAVTVPIIISKQG
jgi:hypothetical protein